MKDTLRYFHKWTDMASDVYKTIAQRKICARNENRHPHQRKTGLFSITASLVINDTKVSEPSLTLAQKTEQVPSITARYLKRTRTIHAAKRTSAYRVNLPINHWITLFGAPGYSLTDGKSQFVTERLSAIDGYPGPEHLITTTHLLTNGQAKLYNQTIATKLRHFYADYWSK